MRESNYLLKQHVKKPVTSFREEVKIGTILGT